MQDSSPQEPSPAGPGGRPSRRDGIGRARGSFDALGTAQTIGALLFGILIVAVPLYLWRRPRASQLPHPDAAAAEPSGAAVSAAHEGGAAVAAEVARPPAVRLAEARVLECHDRGPTRTLPEQCDHIPAFEKALGEAIEASHQCVPESAGAGSIQFVADLSFARRRHPVTLTLPRDGRSFQISKIVKDCTAAVRARITTFPLSALQHAHGRYKISVVATYGGPGAP